MPIFITPVVAQKMHEVILKDERNRPEMFTIDESLSALTAFATGNFSDKDAVIFMNPANIKSFEIISNIFEELCIEERHDLWDGSKHFMIGMSIMNLFTHEEIDDEYLEELILKYHNLPNQYSYDNDWRNIVWDHYFGKDLSAFDLHAEFELFEI